MKYYVIDDNLGTAKGLKSIIGARKGAVVCGFATDPRDALKDIDVDRPEVVLVDLLMQEMDGITLVKEVKKKHPNIYFVMISKIQDKEMVQQAYEAGIEYFIHKPINMVEVDKILSHVEEKAMLTGIMQNIQSLVTHTEPVKEENMPKRSYADEIDIILGSLGMLGEKGTKEIREVYELVARRGGAYNKEMLSEVAQAEGSTVRNVEQRVRRAIKKGMTNAAHVGLDDFDNETFAVYANYVFDFTNLKEEMNFILGKSSCGGRVNITRFMEGLIVYSKNK